MTRGQPSADRVDVDTSAQQVHGCCVPNRMWAHALRRQRRRCFARHSGVLRHETVYSESRQRLVRPPEKDYFILVTVGHKTG